MGARETALITGASSGIGYAFAHCFARGGFDVVLVARREQRLQALAKDLASRHHVTATVIVQDLTIPHAAEKVHRQCEDRGLVIDALINNAGSGWLAPFAMTDRATIGLMIALNVDSLTELTKQFLPGMLQRKHGWVLQVASTAAFTPGPYMAVYHATKAYVLSFSEALHHELRHSGIVVTVLCPGPTKTEFFQHAGMQRHSPHGMNADRVAQIGYDGLMKGKRVVTAGTANRGTVFIMRFLPHRLLMAAVAWVNRSGKRNHPLP